MRYTRAEPCSLMPEPTALARRRAFFSHLAVDVDESRDSLSRRVGPGPTRHDVIKCLSVPKYEQTLFKTFAIKMFIRRSIP